VATITADSYFNHLTTYVAPPKLTGVQTTISFHQDGTKANMGLHIRQLFNHFQTSRLEEID